MSSSARIVWPAGLAIAVATTMGSAEVVLSPAAKSHSASPAANSAIDPPSRDLPAAVNQRQSAETPTLRCWQEGRLVLEQGGVSLGEAPPGAHVFRRKGPVGSPLYVFDMKNGLCILSSEVTTADPVR